MIMHSSTTVSSQCVQDSENKFKKSINGKTSFKNNKHLVWNSKLECACMRSQIHDIV